APGGGARAGPFAVGPAGGTVWFCLTLSRRPIDPCLQLRELEELVDHRVADSVRVLDGLALRVTVVDGRGRIVPEGLEGVTDLRVVQEPREVLGVALRELDREAGGDTGLRGAGGGGGAAAAVGRLHRCCRRT